jgi:hypothetical protein
VAVLIVVVEGLAVANGVSQGATGIGDAPSAEGAGRLVEAPVTRRAAIVGLFDQEVELCFHGSIVPRGCDNSPGTCDHKPLFSLVRRT